MQRNAFLAHLRDRLKNPVPENLPHPLIDVPVLPEVEYARNLDDFPAAYVEAASALGVEVRTIANVHEGEALVRDLVKTHDVRSAVLSDDPETAGVAELLQGLGVEILDYADASRADLGVTGAAFGIAATGTLILDAGRAGSRSTGLLPQVHLALVAESNLLRDSGQLMRKMDEHYPDGPPSQLVFATGPSRTGDIELVLTIGVHAPGIVWVGIILGA